MDNDTPSRTHRGVRSREAAVSPDAAERRRARHGEPYRSNDYSGTRWRYKGLPALGWRHRRYYDMRATFITLAIEDGADPDVIETRVTHSRKARTCSTATTAGCTGSGRAPRSRSSGSRVDRKARRSSNPAAKGSESCPPPAGIRGLQASTSALMRRCSSTLVRNDPGFSREVTRLAMSDRRASCERSWRS